MTERWVINASPLILLARIGQEGLLGALAEEIVVPQEVAGEILAGPETDAIVVLAKQQGLISSAAEVLIQLVNTGFYINGSLAREVLRRSVEEDWPDAP